MKLFAKNDVVAKSKFWYFMALYKKVKRSNGEILHCSEVDQFNPCFHDTSSFGISGLFSFPH